MLIRPLVKYCSIMVALLVLSACGQDGLRTPPIPLGTYAVIESGRFTTYDVAVAQEQVPFKIIMPISIPANIRTYPRIKGPLLTNNDVFAAHVEIRYIGENDHGALLIFENPMPYGNLGAGFNVHLINIDGISVDYYSVSDQLEFYWNYNGLGFHIVSVDYTYDEVLTVIKSMFH